jgi:hypothetical protein
VGRDGDTGDHRHQGLPHRYGAYPRRNIHHRQPTIPRMRACVSEDAVARVTLEPGPIGLPDAAGDRCTTALDTLPPVCSHPHMSAAHRERAVPEWCMRCWFWRPCSLPSRYAQRSPPGHRSHDPWPITSGNPHAPGLPLDGPWSLSVSPVSRVSHLPMLPPLRLNNYAGVHDLTFWMRWRYYIPPHHTLSTF